LSKSLLSRTVPLGLAVTSSIAVLSGCHRKRMVIEGVPVYLYATADDCHWSSAVGPASKVNRSPRGIIGQLEPGSVISVSDEDLAKDSLCYEVKTDSLHGYVLYSRGSYRILP